MVIAPVGILPSAAELLEVRDLYCRGLYLQAYHRAQQIGPLAQWRGAAGRVLAGRLAGNLGAWRLGYLLHGLAWREEPADPEARYYCARFVLSRRGPWAAWCFLQESGGLPAAPGEVHADWLALHATVLAQMRDFDTAEAWLERAEQACPQRAWIYVERSGLLEAEDRYVEALAAARRALELQRWYRPAVQAVAHLLQLLDRDGEALALLSEGMECLECGPLGMQLAGLQAELGRYAEAQRTWARVRELSPMADKHLTRWLAARSADAAYYAGDFAEAVTWARQVGQPYYDKLAERLGDQPGDGRRIQLQVPFVRQHHQTCAPATLAALSNFWQMPADHLEVAAAICYDGTPDHRERAWAEEHGWVVQQFTATWESTLALIDRGLPFALTVTYPSNAHQQAVIGYDSRCRAFIYRDPYMRYSGEYQADSFLEDQRSTGPLGMVLVPLDRGHLLERVVLPDAALYDRVYQLRRALEVHDRPAAEAALRALEQEAPGHRLTFLARRLLAGYDDDQTELLRAVDALLELFPDDGVLLLGKLACLQHLGRREERLEVLKRASERKEANPVFWRHYARELSADARDSHSAARWLRRALRAQPADSGNLSQLANLLWEQGQWEKAFELYRFAACLGDKDEGSARSYFLAARHIKQVDATLEFLRKRFARFAAQSSQPACTLFWAYSLQERMLEAFAVLDQAIALRPDDGELRLFAAGAHSDHGQFAQALALLAQGQGKAPRTTWLRSAARLASAQGELRTALEHWRGVLTIEPLALDAHRAAVVLLVETESGAAALAHLRQACERFPHNYPLVQLLIEWLRDEEPAVREAATREMIAIHPADAWARRELASLLSHQGRHEEAFAELEIARSLEPTSVRCAGRPTTAGRRKPSTTSGV
jgi:tetratricopeptide (TPR) repeat protein